MHIISWTAKDVDLISSKQFCLWDYSTFIKTVCFMLSPLIFQYILGKEYNGFFKLEFCRVGHAHELHLL